MKQAKTVDDFIARKKQWHEELSLLRKIILSTGLEETIKWGSPAYILDGKNIVGIGAFKSYAGLWFFQGALLKDEQGKLVNAQEGRTKALRQWRFQSKEEIDAPLIKSYVEEAIRNQRQGKEIKPARNKPLVIPPELKKVFADQPDLKKKFEALTLSKRREHADYISDAKRETTRLKRLEKIIPLIREQKGLNDQYK